MGPFPTADGHLSIVVYSEKHWRAFTKLAGCPDLPGTGERFTTQESRTRHAEEIGTFIASHLKARPAAEWLRLVLEADIPASPVNSLEDLFGDPHLNAARFFEETNHPTEGRLKGTQFPVTFSATPASVRKHAPTLGEHNRDILGIDSGE